MSSLQRQTFVDDYLKRLQYSGPIEPNLLILKELHRRHMLTFPFENLCNVLHEEYPTTKEELYNKIILEHRGGLCFELNALFALLLQDIGFSVIMVEGMTYYHDEDRWSTTPDHQLSIVYLGEEKWIVDVGFGEGFTVPLRLLEVEIQDDETGIYRIIKLLDKSDQEWFVVESTSKDIVNLHFKNKTDTSADEKSVVLGKKYKFNLTPRTIRHFDELRKIIKDPNSSLSKGLLCTQLRPWGRITLSRYKLVKKYVEDKKITRKEVNILQSQEEVMLILKNEFRINLHVEGPVAIS